MSTEPSDRPMIMIADMCQTHQYLLVQQAGYSRADPWMSLILVAQIALMQAAMCDDKTHDRIGGDLTKIGTLGCLACYKPDAFGEVVEAAKSHDLKDIKALGERWGYSFAAHAWSAAVSEKTALSKVRQAVADYIASEGCGCCSNAEKHAKHRARLARLLDVPEYDDGSGYDFARFRSVEKRRAKR